MTTTRELEKQFATFGEEVPADEVVALVEAGRVVWSWGYGDEEDTFTTIQRDDLWFFYEEPADAALAWGPFRVEP